MEKVMLSCGCASNAVRVMEGGVRIPSCAIHGNTTVVPSPRLEGRVARCAYYGKKTYKNECGKCQNNGICQCERPSDMNLAFFSVHPDRDFDEFYCGCHSWD